MLPGWNNHNPQCGWIFFLEIRSYSHLGVIQPFLINKSMISSALGTVITNNLALFYCTILLTKCKFLLFEQYRKELSRFDKITAS